MRTRTVAAVAVAVPFSQRVSCASCVLLTRENEPRRTRHGLYQCFRWELNCGDRVDGAGSCSACCQPMEFHRAAEIMSVRDCHNLGCREYEALS